MLAQQIALDLKENQIGANFGENLVKLEVKLASVCLEVKNKQFDSPIFHLLIGENCSDLVKIGANFAISLIKYFALLIKAATYYNAADFAVLLT